MSRAAFIDTPKSFTTMLTTSVERAAPTYCSARPVALGEQLLSCEKGQAVLQPQIVALAGRSGRCRVPPNRTFIHGHRQNYAKPSTTAGSRWIGWARAWRCAPRIAIGTRRSGVRPIPPLRGRSAQGGRVFSGRGGVGDRPGHGVARPRMSGWTIVGIPRHTSSSAAMVNPQARISSTVARLQWQPPAKLRHGRSR
jgi:hypothetical protein